jgi:hypothetical protein
VGIAGHDSSLSSRRRLVVTAGLHPQAPGSRSIPFLPAWVATADYTIFTGA